MIAHMRKHTHILTHMMSEYVLHYRNKHTCVLTNDWGVDLINIFNLFSFLYYFVYFFMWEIRCEMFVHNS